MFLFPSQNSLLHRREHVLSHLIYMFIYLTLRISTSDLIMREAINSLQPPVLGHVIIVPFGPRAKGYYRGIVPFCCKRHLFTCKISLSAVAWRVKRSIVHVLYACASKRYHSIAVCLLSKLSDLVF